MQWPKEVLLTCKVRIMSAATSRESLEGLVKHLASPVSSAVQASLLGAGRNALKTCKWSHFQSQLMWRQQIKPASYKMLEAAGMLCLFPDSFLDFASLSQF